LISARSINALPLCGSVETRAEAVDSIVKEIIIIGGYPAFRPMGIIFLPDPNHFPYYFKILLLIILKK
jgi:hypothetical protein